MKDRLHTSHYPRRREDPNIELASHFKRVQVRMPKKTAHDLRGADEILILPSSLTHLKISLHAHYDKRTIRAAVAGDMRLRDVIKQLLPQEYLSDARAYVRSRGEWIEPGAPTKVSDVADLGRFAVNERREVEVKIVVGREREMGHARSGGVGRHGWERERGRVDRMRVY